MKNDSLARKLLSNGWITAASSKSPSVKLGGCQAIYLQVSKHSQMFDKNFFDRHWALFSVPEPNERDVGQFIKKKTKEISLEKYEDNLPQLGLHRFAPFCPNLTINWCCILWQMVAGAVHSCFRQIILNIQVHQIQIQTYKNTNIQKYKNTKYKSTKIQKYNNTNTKYEIIAFYDKWSRAQCIVAWDKLSRKH